MPPPPEDPVLRSSRREAWVVLAISVTALTYTLVYCHLYGYGRSLDSLTFVFGFPDWVFWGIITPWAVCLVASSLFSLAFMRDEDLGDEPDSVGDGEVRRG